MIRAGLSQFVDCVGHGRATGSQCRRSSAPLVGDREGSILERNSDAMNPEARCCADRPCLEGSKSRDRLSGDTHVAGRFFGGGFRDDAGVLFSAPTPFYR